MNLLNIPGNIVVMVFVLSFLIVFHEGGHYLLAKLFKFPVEVFSVGFGKRLFGFKRKETDYRVSLIPLGGYVKVVGLGPDESDIVAGQEAPQAVPGTRLQRLLILFAGPGVNLVLALLLTAVALSLGIEVPKDQYEQPVVKHVDANSPAERAGVRVEDLIVKVGGRPVSTWRDVQTDLGISPREDISIEVLRGEKTVELVIRPEPSTKYDFGSTGLNAFLPATVGQLVAGYPAGPAGLKVGDTIVALAGKPVNGYWEVLRRLAEETAGFASSGPKPVEFVVERDGQRLSIPITPRAEGSSWKVGFRPRFEMVIRPMSFAAALPASWHENIKQARLTFQTVGKLFRGKGSMRQLSGPIDIAKFSGEAARSGAAPLIGLMGMLSLQLGILNLLPIPLLDGGQIFITLLESIFRRDFSVKVKERLLQAGFAFLVLVMVMVLYFDVVKNI